MQTLNLLEAVFTALTTKGRNNMCRISFLKSDGPIDADVKFMLQNLWLINSPGQNDGFGLYNGTSVYRSISPIAQSINEDIEIDIIVEEAKTILLQHSRHASSGFIRNHGPLVLKLSETHPFTPPGVVLVHNGTLRGSHTMDSQALAQSISYYIGLNKTPINAIKKSIAEFYSGSFAVIAEIKGDFYIFRNAERTLFSMEFVHKNVTYLLINTTAMPLVVFQQLLKHLHPETNFTPIKIIGTGIWRVVGTNTIKIDEIPPFHKTSVKKPQGKITTKIYSSYRKKKDAKNLQRALPITNTSTNTSLQDIYNLFLLLSAKEWLILFTAAINTDPARIRRFWSLYPPPVLLQKLHQGIKKGKVSFE